MKSVKSKSKPSKLSQKQPTQPSRTLLSNNTPAANQTPSTPQSTSTTAVLDRTSFAQTLAKWFSHAQRPLAWREPENMHDPYRILVSEVMLQQTTVTAVEPYYRRFLNRFPTLQSLAEAALDEVLTYWAGLGYYQRARNLHACARAIMEKHKGQFPKTLEEVLALPGVGRYTAGAVLSIAFDVPVPIVDANVARVFSRIFCIEGDLKSPPNQRRLWEEAEKLIQSCSLQPTDPEVNSDCRPSIINPALMELGALICVPRQPHCHLCPVETYCTARAAGRQNELPHATPKREVVELNDVCAFAHMETEDGQERILLRQRSHEAKVWWRGMWELPRTTVQKKETPQEALMRLLEGELGVKAAVGTHLKTLQHGVTHHAITLDCWSVDIEENRLDISNKATSSMRWFTWEELTELAIPSTMRRLLKWLHAHPQPDEQLSLI